MVSVWAWGVGVSYLVLRPKFWAASTELFLKALDDAGVHLADSAFAEIQSCTDFFHRELFIVIKDNDQAFVAIQSFGDQSHKITLLNTASRVFTLLVFQNVDLSNIFVAIGLVPFLVQRNEIDRASVGFHLIELSDGKAHVFG